ncbi:MAG: hypothetical protein F6K04_26000, partial [Leptolyngbya sp. SIO4C5]|nr:hypothetical protein [Leptolyngbya sp. SIO4C5]
DDRTVFRAGGIELRAAVDEQEVGAGGAEDNDARIDDQARLLRIEAPLPYYPVGFP